LQELQAAARDHFPEAVEKLVEFMRGAVTVGTKERAVAPRLQVQAALAILDRGLGKPAQQLRVDREAAFDREGQAGRFWASCWRGRSGLLRWA